MRKSCIKYYIVSGPGGYRCTCCFPAPGKRKEIYRSAKRKEKNAAFRLERQDKDSNSRELF